MQDLGKWGTFVVHAAWANHSIARGKRLSEGLYSVLQPVPPLPPPAPEPSTVVTVQRSQKPKANKQFTVEEIFDILQIELPKYRVNADDEVRRKRLAKTVSIRG